MPEYELAPAADRDLLEIARYTIKTWGLEQADRYAAALKKQFEVIGKGEAYARTFLECRPELLFCRCEHHYVFCNPSAVCGQILFWPQPATLCSKVAVGWYHTVTRDGNSDIHVCVGSPHRPAIAFPISA